MINFSHYLPTRFVFGRGVEDQTGEQVRALGATKVLIHYGGGSAVRSGLIARVEASLDAAGVKHVSLGGAEPNPRDTKVYEGIDLIRREKVDFVLAVGGGSAIDSAKAMAHGALYDGDFWDFFCGKAKPEKSLPKGVVLTMSAAGSESSDSCVITQESTKTKRGLNTELNRPAAGNHGPGTTMTLPPYQIACGVARTYSPTSWALLHQRAGLRPHRPPLRARAGRHPRRARDGQRPARLRRRLPAHVGQHHRPQRHPQRRPRQRLRQPSRSSMSSPRSTTARMARSLAVVFPGWLRFMLQKAGQGDAPCAVRRARVGLPDGL